MECRHLYLADADILYGCPPDASPQGTLLAGKLAGQKKEQKEQGDNADRSFWEHGQKNMANNTTIN